MAKSKSINKKISLNDFEQEEFINELFACREPSFCPDLNKTYHTFDLNNLSLELTLSLNAFNLLIFKQLLLTSIPVP